MPGACATFRDDAAFGAENHKTKSHLGIKICRPAPKTAFSRSVAPSGARRAPACDTRSVTIRDEVHRLVDALPESRLPAVETMLRSGLESPEAFSPRRFSSLGTLTAEPDLAARHEEILREDGPEDRDAAAS